MGDRTLADMMRHIPGLAVDMQGKVRCRENPIEKYYIEGLDLLGGRYGLANNSIPAEKAARVEETTSRFVWVRVCNGVTDAR